MAFKKGQSGNPKGRKPGDGLNDSIRNAVEKAAKKEKKTVGEYLWDMAVKDSKLMAKLIDKFISDAPKNVNVTGDITITGLLKEIDGRDKGLPK